MKLKFTKYTVEGILERVLKEEGASDEDREKWRYQVVAYADDVTSGRMDICAACSELQNWYLAMG